MTLLVTGATGFVGQRLATALAAAGHDVRCMTRDAVAARRRFPGRTWIEGDVADPPSLARAMSGCDAAYFLIHGMGEGEDYRRREVAGAEAFAAAAARAGVARLVYLGGIAPSGDASEHLASRLEVGQVLRSGTVPCVELRASMIVGHGSLSWLIVRDLAARLPFMILPRWLESRTQPVAVNDVVVALVRALQVNAARGVVFDLPGPETMSARRILEITARVLGHAPPRIVNVPFLTPWLSSHWVRLVTRARWSVARELVLGLSNDLLAADDRYWGLVGHRELVPFEAAARRAVEEERREAAPVRGLWGALERRRGGRGG